MASTKRVLTRVLVVLVAIVAVFTIVVALQPSEFRVERSAAFAAPPEAVFAQVNNLRNWESWSPWAKRDPNAKESYEGPPAGPGAVFCWSGNCEIGEGRMTILESRPNERIRMRLDFKKPMEETSSTEFAFKPEGDGTRVTWRMHGHNGFAAKAFGLFMDMEKMVADDFEQGLAQMRAIVEAPQPSTIPAAQAGR